MRFVVSSLMAGIVASMMTNAALAGPPPCVPSWNTAIGNRGMTSYIADFYLYDDGLGGGPQLYATGAFGSAGGVANTGLIARWDGLNWNSVGGGFDTTNFSNVLEVFNNELYVGGYFNLAGGVPGTAKLAKWNGTAWSSLNAQLDQFDDSIWSLKVFNDGGGNDLYVGGNYQDIGGTTLDYIARWDGATFTEVGGTIAGPVALIVLALEVYNGELYAGGRFTTVAGVPATHLARWNGTNWQNVSGSITGTQVLCMKVWNDGSGPALYVAGAFTAAGGVPAVRIAKWNGTTWSALAGGLSGNVNALEVFDDGSGEALYAVGAFTMSGATPVSRIARWNGATWSAVDAGLNNTGFALLAVDNGLTNSLYIGGSFTAANGLTANRAVRYDGCPTAVPGDIDGNMFVNVDDLLMVINAWGACPLPCRPHCPADIAPAPNGNCFVNVDDLLMVINNWG